MKILYNLETGIYSLGIPYADKHSWLLEYIGMCKCGEDIIGHELMLELDRLLKLFDDPEIKIEFEDAHKRIKFIETKCKHFEAPFAGKPFILMPFQKHLLRRYILSRYMMKKLEDI